MYDVNFCSLAQDMNLCNQTVQRGPAITSGHETIDRGGGEGDGREGCGKKVGEGWWAVGKRVNGEGWRRSRGERVLASCFTACFPRLQHPGPSGDRAQHPLRQQALHQHLLR